MKLWVFLGLYAVVSMATTEVTSSDEEMVEEPPQQQEKQPPQQEGIQVFDEAGKRSIHPTVFATRPAKPWTIFGAGWPKRRTSANCSSGRWVAEGPPLLAFVPTCQSRPESPCLSLGTDTHWNPIGEHATYRACQNGLKPC